MLQKQSIYQTIKDFITFPIRAVTLFEKNRWGLTALMLERYYYVSQEVIGFCLDIGCGKNNRFINEFLAGQGIGLDVYKYAGLTNENLITDPKHFPVADERFDSVTFIANINHIPKPLRDIELKEAYRCLKTGGNIIVTMGNPLAEILTHKIVAIYDKFLGTTIDVDTERGMEEEEAYYLLNREIEERLLRAGFSEIKKKYFITQWGLNHLFVAWKK